MQIMTTETLADIETRFVSAIFKDSDVMGLLERANLGPEIVTSPLLNDVLTLCFLFRFEGREIDFTSFYHEAMREPFCDALALADLLSAADTSFHAKSDLSIMIEDYKRRTIRTQASTLSNLVDDGEWDENSAAAQALIREIADVEIGSKPLSQRDRAMEAITGRRKLIDGIVDRNAVSIETGIDCIDRYCRPLSVSTGDFNCLLFAATSTGKSSLMAQMVSHNVFRNLKVAVFLGETNHRGFIEQMAGQLSRVSIDEYDFKQEPADRQEAYMENLEDIASRCGSNLWIYDDRFKIEDIVNRCKSLAADEGGLDFVVIDHMHCLKTRQKFTDERLKYNYISGQLKPLGIELNCPILCLAQPSRALKSSDRPPMLSDLKESGNLEDDADRVWALWLPPKDSHGMDQERKSPHPQIKLYQLKFRRGRVTDVTLRLEKQYTLFTDDQR